MEIKQNLIGSLKYALKCPNMMTATYITIHNTANDASAANEVAYMISNTTSTSFHFAVDDKEIIQSIPIDRNAWHCGDGSATNSGNRTSIGIEICYSKSGGDRYNKAEELTAKLTAKLLKDRGWKIDRVKKHQDWSGKYCPHRILDKSNGWKDFLNKVQSELDALTPIIPIVPKTTSIKFNLLGKFIEVNGHNVNDRNYAQARPLIEGLNLKIDWDSKTSTVKIIGEGDPINKITKDDGIKTTVKFNLFEKLNLDIPGYIDNGITYVQIRSLLESMGYVVVYNGTNKVTEVSKPQPIQTPIIEIKKEFIDVKLKVLGKDVNIEGQNINSRAYVKARDLIESLGFTVGWNAISSSVRVIGNGTPSNKTVPDNEVGTVKFNLFDKLDLDIPGYVYNGTTYSQVRSLCESMGFVVGWNETLKVIEITQEKEKTTYNKVNITLEEAVKAQLKYNPVKSDKGAWVPATLEDLRDFMNPGRYYIGDYKYQFLNLSEMAGISLEDAKNFLKGKGVLAGKEQVYLDAAKKYGISEVYLLAHSNLETGGGTTKLAKGIEVNGVKVYNFFGIGAADKDPDGLGSKKAFEMGWDSVDKAIDGGAKWIAESYINNKTHKQNTLYKMRWNPAAIGTHMYATDVQWALKQCVTIKKLYSGFPTAILNFDITQYS